MLQKSPKYICQDPLVQVYLQFFSKMQTMEEPPIQLIFNIIESLKTTATDS